MADELRLSAIFDVSGVVEGVSAFEEQIASLAGPLESLAADSEAVATQSSNMATQMNLAAREAGELEAALSGVNEELSAGSGGAAFSEIGSSFAAIGEEAQQVLVVNAEMQAGINAVTAEMQAEVAAIDEVAAAYSALGIDIAGTAGAMEASAAAGSIASTELEAEAADTEAAALGYSDLIAAKEAEIAATEEAAIAEAAQEDILIDIATQQVAAAAATAAASGATQAFSATVAQGATATAALRQAVAAFNAAQVQGTSATLQQNTAYQALAQAAQRAGFAIAQNGNTLTLNTQKVNQNTQALSENAKMLGYLGGRAAAYELGLGQLGFGFGILGRSISSVNSILVAAFPIIGAVLLAEVISSLSDKFKAMEEEIRKSIIGFDDLGTQSLRNVESIEIQTLKLEDEISKLEGRPETNKLAEAIAQSREEVDKLTDSFEHALEKSEDLLKSGEVGAWRSFLTGDVQTTKTFGSGFDDEIKPRIDALRSLVAAQNEANVSLSLADNEENRNRKANADKAVATEQDKTLHFVQEFQKRVQTEKAAALEVAQRADEFATHYKPGFFPTGEVERVSAQFVPLESRLAALTTVLQANTLAKLENAKADKARAEAAALADEESARTRALTLSEAAVKADERSRTQQVQLAKETAESELHAAQAGVNSEVAALVLGGASKNQAELAYSFNRRELIRQETQDKLNALKRESDATLANLREQKLQQEQLGKVGTDKSGNVIEAPEQQAALFAIQSEIEDAQKSYWIRRRNIERDGNTALLNEKVKDNEAEGRILEEEKKMLAEANKAFENAIVKRQEMITKGQEQTLKFQVGQERDPVRGIEEELRANERLFEEGRISRTEEQSDLQRTIGLLQEKYSTTKKSVDELQRQLQLEASRTLAPGQISPTGGQLTPGTEQYKDSIVEQERLQALIKQQQSMMANLASTIDSAGAAFNRLDTSASAFFTKMRNQELTAGLSWKSFTDQFQLSWQHALDQVNTKFTNSVGQWILHGGSFVRAMQNMGAELVASFAESFIRLGLVMLENWIASLLGIKVAQTTSSAEIITAHAAEAGAAGVASWAGAPWPVDAGAPAFGASMAAAALAFLPGAAAEQGAFLDRDMNVLAHKNEMILPSKYARTIQNISSNNEGKMSVNNTSNTGGNSIGRLQFQNVQHITGTGFDANQHAGDMMKALESRLRRKGYSI